MAVGDSPQGSTASPGTRDWRVYGSENTGWSAQRSLTFRCKFPVNLMCWFLGPSLWRMLSSFSWLLGYWTSPMQGLCYQLNILGAEGWLVFLIISSTEIFYLAFWIFLAGTCAILFHLVSLSRSSFSSNRIFIDFHYSGRKKRGKEKSLLRSSLFSPPTWIIWGVTAALRAYYKSVHLLDYFAYTILNLSSH